MAEIFRHNPAIRQLELPFTPHIHANNDKIISEIPGQINAYQQQQLETAALAKRAAAWLTTPEGSAQMNQALRNAKEMAEERLRPKRQLTWDDLYSPVTI